MLRAPMKRSVALFSALTGLTASIRIGLRHAEEARNVSRLRSRYGLGERDAKRLYRMARSEGFGYAAQRVLRDHSPASAEDVSDHDHD